MIKLLDLLKEDGQKTSTKNMDDYKKQNNPSGKIKDPLGLKAYAQELSRGLEEADPKKGTGKNQKDQVVVYTQTKIQPIQYV